MAEEKQNKAPETAGKEKKAVVETKTAVDVKKKKMPKVLKIVLLAVGGFVAIVVGLGVLFFTASSGATKVSDEFLNAMQAGDGATAYNLFSSKAKKQLPKEESIGVIGQIGAILNTEEKKVSTNVSAETGSDTEAVVVYEIEGTDGVTYMFAVTLVKEDGQWKVLNFDSDKKDPAQ